MTAGRPRRAVVRALVAAALVAAPLPAAAQQWVIFGGMASRLEYNDNYFFVADDARPVAGRPASRPEEAFTASIIPFVAAARRTEVSDVTALVALGGNKVWGPSEEYVSARFALDGTLREARSTWSGSASYSRSPSLQSVVRDSDVIIVLAYTDAAAVGGSYKYALTDRWTLGASLSAYANRYDSVEETDALDDARGMNLGGTLDYAFSDRTRLNYVLGYTYFRSDATRSDAVTTTLGVVHQYSPSVTVSASVGGFWAETKAREVLPGGGDPIAPGEKRRDDGTFFGGGIDYAYSESTRFSVSVTQSLAPSGTGTLNRSDRARVGVSHQFSERLSAHVGASYDRARFPSALDSSSKTETLQGQVGMTYALAERWKLEAGYQYARARYSQDATEPRSNLVFVSVAYNWPGSAITGWVGRPSAAPSLQGAGPLSLPETTPAAPTETTPFEPFTLP